MLGSSRTLHKKRWKHRWSEQSTISQSCKHWKYRSTEGQNKIDVKIFLPGKQSQGRNSLDGDLLLGARSPLVYAKPAKAKSGSMTDSRAILATTTKPSKPGFSFSPAAAIPSKRAQRSISPRLHITQGCILCITCKAGLMSGKKYQTELENNQL